MMQSILFIGVLVSLGIAVHFFRVAHANNSGLLSIATSMLSDPDTAVRLAMSNVRCMHDGSETIAEGMRRSAIFGLIALGLLCALWIFF